MAIEIEDFRDIESMPLEELKEYHRYCQEKALYYDVLQQALKILINAVYGAEGTPAFRYFAVSIAASITALGRMSIRACEKGISKYVNDLVGEPDAGSRSVAGDTDSVYVNLYPLIQYFGLEDASQEKKVDFLDKAAEMIDAKVIKPVCNDIFVGVNGEKSNSKTLNMDREAICVCADKDSYCGFWLARKHYFLLVNDMEGLRYEKPHVKAMGVQWKQTSFCNFARKNMSELVEILTKDGIEKFREKLKEVKKAFYELPPEEMAFPRGVSDIVKYTDPKTGLPWVGEWFDQKEQKKRKGGVPIHVKSAIYFNSLLKKYGMEKKIQKLVNGAKIYYLYLKENKHGFGVIGFRDKLPSEFQLHDSIDVDNMWYRQIYKIMEDVCSTCGLDIVKRRDMSEFF